MILEEKLYEIIGERLAARRKEINMTQDAIAEAVELERTSITNIEAGRQKAPLSLLYRLCAALKVDPLTILPTNKEVADDRTVTFGVGEKKEEIPVSVSGINADISDQMHKNIGQLLDKINK